MDENNIFLLFVIFVAVYFSSCVAMNLTGVYYVRMYLIRLGSWQYIVGLNLSIDVKAILIIFLFIQ